MFVILVTLTSNKFQYIHFPPEMFIRSFFLHTFILQFRTKMHTCRLKKRSRYERVFSTRNFSLTQIILLQMIEQTILQLIVKSSLRYVIRNRSYSHLKKFYRTGTLSSLGCTEETKHIENKSLNAEFQRYILFFILVLWLAVYQLNHNHSPIQYSGRLLH